MWTSFSSEGQEVINLSYKGKEQFRVQLGYIMDRIKTVSQKLPKMRPGAKPHMKMTYYDDRKCRARTFMFRLSDRRPSL
jgi:hypothetical protein